MINAAYISDTGYNPGINFSIGGITTSNFSLPLSEADFTHIMSSPPEYILIETKEGAFIEESMLGKIAETFGNISRLIFITGALTESVRETMLKYGISDIIGAGDTERIINYITALHSLKDFSTGKIAIFEKQPVTSRHLGNIIRQFGFTPVFMDSFNSFEKLLKKENVQMVLLNLEFDRVTIKNLIKKTINDMEIRMVPVISYKDMARGIFVHEIVSGLNRLTKVILSHEELYSYLLDLLFRKKIIPVTDILNKSADYESSAYYSKKTLSQIFYMNEKDMLYSKNILAEENYEGMLHAVSLLRQSLILAEGLKWMRVNPRRDNLSSFEASGRT